MARPIPIGVRGEAEETVELKHSSPVTVPNCRRCIRRRT